MIKLKTKILKRYKVSASLLFFYDEIEIEAESEQKAKDTYYQMLKAGKIKSCGKNCEDDDIDCEEIKNSRVKNNKIIKKQKCKRLNI